MTFKHIKVGDVITRNMAGIEMKMKVSSVDDKLITAGMGWQFDRETGWEVDLDLGWGPEYGRTGSYLQ